MKVRFLIQVGAYDKNYEKDRNLPPAQDDILRLCGAEQSLDKFLSMLLKTLPEGKIIPTIKRLAMGEPYMIEWLYEDYF